MKKIIIGLVLVGACHSARPDTSGSPVAFSGQGGAADPATAVRGFMSAAKKTDLQAMGALWGDQTALARDRFPSDELQKRELILMRCLRHDTYDIVGDAPSLGGSRAVAVQLIYGELTRSSTIEVVRGPSQRWFVRDVDMAKLQDICVHKA